MSARTLAPWALPALMLAMAASVAAEQDGDVGGYRLDPVHTRVLLGIDHEQRGAEQPVKHRRGLWQRSARLSIVAPL